MSKTLGVIGGAGQMANALLRSILRCCSPKNLRGCCSNLTIKSIKKILIYDPIFDMFPEKKAPFLASLRKFNSPISIELASSAEELAANSHVALICIKPQMAVKVLTPLQGLWGTKTEKNTLKEPTLVISIMGGVPILVLEKLILSSSSASNNKGFFSSGNSQQQPQLPGIRIVRVMPNIGVLSGAGASGYSGNQPNCSSNVCHEAIKQQNHYVNDMTHALLSSGGIAVAVPESSLDAVTGVSGSGPAFAAAFIEAMSDGGVSAGLPRPLATRLAVQCVLGTARLLSSDCAQCADGNGNAMVNNTCDIKNMVCSPAGTTIRGVEALEQNKLRAAVMAAVKAAAERSRTLRRESEQQSKL